MRRKSERKPEYSQFSVIDSIIFACINLLRSPKLNIDCMPMVVFSAKIMILFANNFCLSRAFTIVFCYPDERYVNKQRYTTENENNNKKCRTICWQKFYSFISRWFCVAECVQYCAKLNVKRCDMNGYYLVIVFTSESATTTPETRTKNMKYNVCTIKV